MLSLYFSQKNELGANVCDSASHLAAPEQPFFGAGQSFPFPAMVVNLLINVHLSGITCWPPLILCLLEKKGD